MYCLQARPCIFQPGNFIGWCNEGVNMHRSGVLTVLFGCYTAGATRSCCRLGAHSIYIIQPRASLHSHFFRSHMRSVQVRQFSCSLLSALLAEWPWSFTCYCSTVMYDGWYSVEVNPLAGKRWMVWDATRVPQVHFAQCHTDHYHYYCVCSRLAS